jgi:hypothetical protein
MEPTISRWLSSSVAMSMKGSYIFEFFSRSTNAWVKYCIAAFNSPLAPPKDGGTAARRRGGRPRAGYRLRLTLADFGSG